MKQANLSIILKFYLWLESRQNSNKVYFMHGNLFLNVRWGFEKSKLLIISWYFSDARKIVVSCVSHHDLRTKGASFILSTVYKQYWLHLQDNFLFVIKIINISRREKQQFFVNFLFPSTYTLLNATSTNSCPCFVFACRFDDWIPTRDELIRHRSI